jgi:hypothetical protein
MQSISLSISSCSWADIVCHRDGYGELFFFDTGYGELCGNWEAFFFFRLKNFQFVHQVSFLTESSEPKQMVLVTVTLPHPRVHTMEHHAPGRQQETPGVYVACVNPGQCTAVLVRQRFKPGPGLHDEWRLATKHARPFSFTTYPCWDRNVV